MNSRILFLETNDRPAPKPIAYKVMYLFVLNLLIEEEKTIRYKPQYRKIFFFGTSKYTHQAKTTEVEN